MEIHAEGLKSDQARSGTWVNRIALTSGSRKGQRIPPPPTHFRDKHSMKTVNFGLVICAVSAAFMGLAYLLFDPIVKHVVLRRLVLSDNSEFAQIWQNPPITPHFKIYFFNLTNPEEVFAGRQLPVLEEVGPYVYHQKWTKQDVQWHDNGTMSYRTKKDFSFVREASVGDHSSDVIVTLNVPVISAYYQMRDSSFFTAFLVEQIISGLDYKMWVKKSPEELIWGYDEPLFDLARLALPQPPPLEKFGFFSMKNDSSDLPIYTMYTGEGNPYSLSKISLFNGDDSLNIWGVPNTSKNVCNKVQGSDGATFNPYIQKSDTLWFFNDQLCRSIPLVFDRDVESNGLPGYRFVPRDDVFVTKESAPDNSCFCEGEPLCDMIGDGMFAVSKCQMDAPVILSWPHFLHANVSYLNAVKGLKPDEKKHGFHFDIQEITGTTISARARIQINLAVKKISTFTDLSKINDSVIPILWFDEGLDELAPELRNVIATAVLEPPVFKNYILCVLLGLVLSTLVIGSVAFIRVCLNRSVESRRKRVTSSLFLQSENLDDGYSQRKMEQFAVEFGSEEDDKFRSVKNIFSGHVIPHHPPSSLVRIAMNNHCEAAQKLLDSGPDTGCSTSTDSSRISSASHSRNSSTGSNYNQGVSSRLIPMETINSSPAGVTAEQEEDNERCSVIHNVASSQALLNPKTNLPNI